MILARTSTSRSIVQLIRALVLAAAFVSSRASAQLIPGPGILNVKSAPFGAKCDGKTDDTAALQAAIDKACVDRMPLYVPPGNFPHGDDRKPICAHRKPVVARCNPHIFGVVAASGMGSTLRPLDYTGPDILIEPADAAGITPGPALVGKGASYQIEPANPVTLNLRQTRTAELDGLSAFTAEAAFMLPASRSSTIIVASSGGVSGLGGALPGKTTQDMALLVDDGVLKGRLRVNRSRHELGYGPITAKTPHYAALTFDGNTISLYYDGNQVAAGSAPGRITQDVTDDVTIGVMNQTGPEGQMVNGSDAGVLIDSVRLSDSARYSGPGMAVPGREFDNDRNTIALVNFDDNTPQGFIKAEQGVNSDYPSTVYSVVERTKDLKGRGLPFVGGVYIHDLWFQGGLWCWLCTFESRFDNLLFQYSYMGLVLGGNSNEDQVNSLSVLKGGPQMRYGLLMTTANGARVNGAQIDGSVFPLVIQGAARTWLSDLLITPTSHSQYGVLTFGAAPSFRGLYFDEEDPTPPGFVGSLVEVSNWSAGEVSGLEIDNFQPPGPRPVIIDGSESGYGVTITAGYAGDSGPLPSVTINGKLKSPVILSNVQRRGSGPLTDNPSQSIIVDQQGPSK